MFSFIVLFNFIKASEKENNKLTIVNNTSANFGATLTGNIVYDHNEYLRNNDKYINEHITNLNDIDKLISIAEWEKINIDKERKIKKSGYDYERMTIDQQKINVDNIAKAEIDARDRFIEVLEKRKKSILENKKEIESHPSRCLIY